MTTRSVLHGRGIASCLGLELSWPIVQAPMAGGITTTDLVVAVCEAGALGALAAPLLSPTRMAEAVAAIRARTRRPFAVNLFVLEEPGSFTRDGQDEAIARLAPWRARYGLPALTPPAVLCESFSAQLDALIALAPAVACFLF